MIRVVPVVRPCDVESLADFSRYYRFSYIGWNQHPDGPQPINIQNVAEGVTAQDLQGRAFILDWRQVQRECSFGTPDLGMVNTEHTILYLYRQAAREAHRGFRPGGTMHTHFNGWSIRSVAPQLNPGDRTVLQRLFYPEYYQAQEALEALNRGDRVGCALSRNLGIYTTPQQRCPSIAYRRNTVGYLENDVAVIPRMYSDAIPAIRDKIGVEVVIK